MKALDARLAAALQAADKGEAAILARALLDACARGEVAHEAGERPLPQRRTVGYIGSAPAGASAAPARLERVTLVGPAAFGAWLKSRGLEPSAKVRAWLATLPGAASQAVPVAQPEPTAGDVIARRQDGRLARLRALGADYVPQGAEWRVRGQRGAFKALCDAERDAGRTPYDAHAVRADLLAAAEREAEARRQGEATERAAFWMKGLGR